jgi:hypothetical protein
MCRTEDVRIYNGLFTNRNIDTMPNKLKLRNLSTVTMVLVVRAKLSSMSRYSFFDKVVLHDQTDISF